MKIKIGQTVWVIVAGKVEKRTVLSVFTVDRQSFITTQAPDGYVAEWPLGGVYATAQTARGKMYATAQAAQRALRWWRRPPTARSSLP